VFERLPSRPLLLAAALDLAEHDLGPGRLERLACASVLFECEGGRLFAVVEIATRRAEERPTSMCGC
jgi:hypothetical protein